MSHEYANPNGPWGDGVDMTPEGKIKAMVKAELKSLRHCKAFWPVQSGIGADALDCLLNVGGRHVEIETKAPGKTLTPRQETLRDECLDAGGLFFLVDGRDSLDCMMMTLRTLNNYYIHHHAARSLPAGQ